MEKELKTWESLVTINDKYDIIKLMILEDRFTLKLKSHKYLKSTYILLPGNRYYISWSLSKNKITLLVEKYCEDEADKVL